MANATTARRPKLKTRKPTGNPPWPLVLLEGDEKAGKSYALAVLSASDRVGMCYWLDLGEGSADEYAAIPGAEYEVIDHDGTYREILEQVTAVYFEAQRAAEAGEPPVVLGIDSMSAFWAMLVSWTNARAARSKNNQRLLASDPDAEINVTSNFWNDANARNRRIMDMLMTFPGIAVVTARGKEVAAMGANGQPIEGKKEWKVEGQKALAFDSTVWVRMFRSPRSASIVGARSLHLNIDEGKPMQVEDFSIEKLVFNMMKCGGKGTTTRDLKALAGDQLQRLLATVADSEHEDDLKELWADQEKALRPEDRSTLSDAITARLEVLRNPESNFDDDAPARKKGKSKDAEKLADAAAAKEAESDEDAA